MGEVTEVLGVTPRTIRHYDQKGLLPRAKRSSGMLRLFDEEDLDLIREIRRLQKTENLSLDQIKERLYGKPTGNMALVTDQTANILPDSYPFLRVLDLDNLSEEAIIELLKSTYQAQLDDGMYCVYSIHSGEPYSTIANMAQKAAKSCSDPRRIRVLELPIMGAVLGLLGHVIGEHIRKHCLEQELQKLIEEVWPYMGMIFTVSSIESLYQHKSSETPFEASLRKGIQGAMPILMQSTRETQMTLKEFVTDGDDIVTVLADVFEQELTHRSRFLSYVAITHYQQLELAMSLSELLQDRHIKIPILIVEERAGLSAVLGPKLLGISFV